MEDEDCCSPTPTFLSSYPPPPTPNLPPAPLSPPRSSSSGWPPSLSVCVSSFAYIRSLSSGHFCDSLFPEWRSPTPDGRMVIRTFPNLLPLPPIPTHPHTHVLAAPCRMRKVRPLLLPTSSKSSSLHPVPFHSIPWRHPPELAKTDGGAGGCSSRRGNLAEVKGPYSSALPDPDTRCIKIGGLQFSLDGASILPVLLSCISAVLPGHHLTFEC